MLDASRLLYTQIAAGVCVLIFASLAYNLLRLRRQMAASKTWIKAEGEIIASEAKIPLPMFPMIRTTSMPSSAIPRKR